MSVVAKSLTSLRARRFSRDVAEVRDTTRGACIFGVAAKTQTRTYLLKYPGGEGMRQCLPNRLGKVTYAIKKEERCIEAEECQECRHDIWKSRTGGIALRYAPYLTSNRQMKASKRCTANSDKLGSNLPLLSRLKSRPSVRGSNTVFVRVGNRTA